MNKRIHRYLFRHQHIKFRMASVTVESGSGVEKRLERNVTAKKQVRKTQDSPCGIVSVREFH